MEKKKSAKSEAQLTSLRLLVDYLTHVKLNHAIHRNLTLIEALQEGGRMKVEGGGGGAGRVAKPEEFVRVYDILLQVVGYSM